jgi:hypothetical protein
MITQQAYDFATQTRHTISRTDGGSDGYNVVICNGCKGNNAVYLGNATATAADGIKLVSGASIQLRLGQSEILTAFTTDTGVAIHVLYTDLEG